MVGAVQFFIAKARDASTQRIRGAPSPKLQRRALRVRGNPPNAGMVLAMVDDLRNVGARGDRRR